jgi:hypothetical protein
MYRTWPASWTDPRRAVPSCPAMRTVVNTEAIVRAKVRGSDEVPGHRGDRGVPPGQFLEVDVGHGYFSVR